MGARNRAGKGLSYRPARLRTQPGGTGSLESMLGLVRGLITRAPGLNGIIDYPLGYSDFHNLMGFTSKKMPNNILKNVC